MIEGQVMASANGQATGALVRGLKPEDLRARAILADNIKFGDLDDFMGRDSVLIGTRLARKLGLKVGDKITLISPKGNITAIGTVPRLRSYKIAALFKVGMHEYDSSFIFMPLAAAQKYFKLPQAVNYLDVVIDEPDAAGAKMREVWRAVGAQGRVYDWQNPIQVSSMPSRWSGTSCS